MGRIDFLRTTGQDVCIERANALAAGMAKSRSFVGLGCHHLAGKSLYAGATGAFERALHGGISAAVVAPGEAAVAGDSGLIALFINIKKRKPQYYRTIIVGCGVYD